MLVEACLRDSMEAKITEIETRLPRDQAPHPIHQQYAHQSPVIHHFLSLSYLPLLHLSFLETHTTEVLAA